MRRKVWLAYNLWEKKTLTIHITCVRDYKEDNKKLHQIIGVMDTHRLCWGGNNNSDPMEIKQKMPHNSYMTLRCVFLSPMTWVLWPNTSHVSCLLTCLSWSSPSEYPLQWPGYTVAEYVSKGLKARHNRDPSRSLFNAALFSVPDYGISLGIHQM